MPLNEEKIELNALEYISLREKGIQLLQQLAGHNWTDHNLHDPGITILEQLCYALSDLGHRLGYHVRDLIANNNTSNSLYSPGQVMGTAPITLRDMRKLILDVPGVKNARIEKVTTHYSPQIFYDDSTQTLGLGKPLRAEDTTVTPLQLKGLYRVYFIAKDIEKTDALKYAVRKKLMANRNLCEDIEAIETESLEKVTLNIEIELESSAQTTLLPLRLSEHLHQYVSPSIRFYSLGERLAAGKSIDEIFEGPRLDQGFIDDEEMDRFQLKQQLNASEIIQLIMELEGIQSVSRFDMKKTDDDAKGYRAVNESKETWQLVVSPGYSAFAIDTEHSRITFRRNGIKVLESGIIQTSPQPVKEKSTHREDYVPAPGRNRQAGRYLSIQHHFPDLYGIGIAGLPSNASEKRNAHVKQLKAYLAFFDQLLSDYFAQLGFVGDLFSFTREPGRTYAKGTLSEEDGIVGFSELFQQQVTDDERESPDREQRLLDHLLARFAEDFSEYTLIHSADSSQDPNTLAREKLQFLQDYPRLSYYRAAAFDYSQPLITAYAGDQPSFSDVPGDENISGLWLRIARKLGIKAHPWRRLYNKTSFKEDEERFYLLEHILLRPFPDDPKNTRAGQGEETSGDLYQGAPLLYLPFDENAALPPLTDPYSLQLSFVFPNTGRYKDTSGFKNLVQQVVREETPAHLSIYIHWLEEGPMERFEEAHGKWLNSLYARTKIPENE